MFIKRVGNKITEYAGVISNSITAYYVSIEPQPEIEIPFTLPGYIPISLSSEGYLVSFEFIDLSRERREIPSYKPEVVLERLPAFNMPSNESGYEWDCFRKESDFLIQFNNLNPNIEYRVRNARFYCKDSMLVAVQVNNCEVIE